MKKRALLSVSDKTGIIDLARELDNLGYEILSTGGTAKTIKEAGLPVTKVSDVTGFPEILGGRVKTLHPKIHGGILAMRTEEHLAELAAQDISPIDIVVVNLYPFKKTIEREDCTYELAIENIDIGGPTMVRASAKNHAYITIVVKPERYAEVLAELKDKGETSLELRKKLALEAFEHTAAYDCMISGYLSAQIYPGELPETFFLKGEKKMSLRYGENPHQKAAFYVESNKGLGGAKQYQGKELSFNNIMDLEAAWEIVSEFSEPASIIIKHTNPCGAAIGTDALEAYVKAHDCDPLSAFGSIVSINREINADVAKELTKTFVEAIIAPGYTKEALEVLSAKKNLRVMEADLPEKELTYDVKKVSGGFLVQEKDRESLKDGLEWVTEAKGDESLAKDLEFAWKIVKHVKSNAIVVAKDGAAIGVGPGQTNRVGAARIALEHAKEKAEGSVLASDAFFPFRDTVDLAHEYGVKAIIQPGGSVNDQVSVEACNEHGIAMAYTGMRHFKH